VKVSIDDFARRPAEIPEAEFTAQRVLDFLRENHRDQRCWMAIAYGKVQVQNFRLVRQDAAAHTCELEATTRRRSARARSRCTSTRARSILAKCTK